MSENQTQDLSVQGLRKSDAALKDVDFDKWLSLAADDLVETTKKSLETQSHKCSVVKNKTEALELIKSLIPKGSEVMNAGSTTLVILIFDLHLARNWFH